MLRPLRLEFGPLPFGPFADPSSLQVTADALSQEGDVRGTTLTLALSTPTAPTTTLAAASDESMREGEQRNARWNALLVQTRLARGAVVKTPTEDTLDVHVYEREHLDRLILPGQKWRVKRLSLCLSEAKVLEGVFRFDGFPRLRHLSLIQTEESSKDALAALEGSSVLEALDVLEVSFPQFQAGPLDRIAEWLSPLRLRSARPLERHLRIDRAHWTLTRAPAGAWRLDCVSNLMWGRADHPRLLAALPPGEIETFSLDPERLSLESHAQVTAAARAIGIKELLIKPPVVPRATVAPR